MRRLNAVRNRKQTLKVLKELDAFPKVPENYQQTSASGGSGEYVREVLLKHASSPALATEIYYRPYCKQICEFSQSMCGDCNPSVLTRNHPFLARISAFLFSLIILPVFKTLPSESKVVFIAQDQYALH